MTERMLNPDLEIRGKPHELWVDSDHNWWLVPKGGDTGIGPDDFTPRLTDQEVERLTNYIFDYFSDID